MEKQLFVVVCLCLICFPAFAGLTVIGEGDGRRFDPSSFPPAMQKSYSLMETKCSKANCHAFGRVVEAVTTGIAPISKTAFDKAAAKAYGVKMMRKPDSGIDKSDAKAIVELLYFLIDEEGK